jgi:predicted Zn-dependent peptidase
MTDAPLARSPRSRPRWRQAAAIALAALAAATGVVAQQGPDRSKPPAPGPAPSLKLPPIQKRALSNGLPVWIVEMHEVPLANVSLIVRAGAMADPAGKLGVAHFTAAMLDEGAGSRSALELADAIEFLGASISTGSSFDAATVRLQAPVARIDAALPLMADVAVRPAFAANEVERLKKERLTSLLQARDSAGTLADAAFARVLFGPRHRYGTLGMGNESSNGEMTPQDLRSFHAAHYQPRNSHLLVVGDVTAATVLPQLERAFGSWKNAGATPAAKLDAAAQHAARQVYLVDKPGAAQSEIRIGWIGVPRSTPDYYALQVLNTALGGSFSSRLNLNLREQHGYSYGAGSYFDMRIGAGPFAALAAVQTDKTVESLQEFFKELDGIILPMPADELARARNYLALGYPAGFETTAGMASNLISMIVHGLPETFFNEYVSRIQAVTPADVLRVAKQYIQPDRFAVVVVGDLAKIEKPIRALNLGNVRVLTADEILK